MIASTRPTWAEIDLAAAEENARLVASLVSPSALWAVVKADAYGHGAPQISRAALRGGASALAVAVVEEGVVLRDTGIDAPILLLSEPSAEAMVEAALRDLTPTIYSEAGIAAARAAARIAKRRLGVHVKVDTGMHRVGCAPEDLVGVCRSIAAADELDFEGCWTHFAVADDPDDPFTALQLARFETALRALDEAGIAPRVRHAANSAGALAHPAARFDAVRCGIALYGYAPSGQVAAALGSTHPGARLRPVLSLHSRVHAVHELAQGERPSYGRVRELGAPSRVAVVPIGYADGVRRDLERAGAAVLIGGERRPFLGTITMDLVLVDCGSDESVRVGDEVVLLGRQGNESIDANEWATHLRTIPYEVLCGIGPRVPRLVTGAPRASGV